MTPSAHAPSPGQPHALESLSPVSIQADPQRRRQNPDSNATHVAAAAEAETAMARKAMAMPDHAHQIGNSYDAKGWSTSRSRLFCEIAAERCKMCLSRLQTWMASPRISQPMDLNFQDIW